MIDGGTDGERVVEELLPNLAAIGVFASEDPAKAIPRATIRNLGGRRSRSASRIQRRLI